MIRRLLATMFLATFAAWGCSQENATQPSTDMDAEQMAKVEALEAQINSEVAARDNVLAKTQRWIPITGPTVITEPGYYRVINDFTATEDAIVIQSNDVVLRLDSRTITGPGDDLGRGIVLDGVSNCDIAGANGVLTNFALGIQLVNSHDCWVRNITVMGADRFADPANGVAPQIGLMAQNSHDNLFYHNRFEMINLGMFVRGDGSYDNTLFLNLARGGNMGLLGICYNPDGSGDPAAGHDDTIIRNLIVRFPLGMQFVAGAHDNKILVNTIQYFNLPWEDFNGTNQFVLNWTKQIQP